jgi:hypothetical protein
MLDGPPEELKRPSESEQEPCNGKKPRTEDPLVAADVLACFAGPGSEDEHDSSNTTDAAPSSEKKQPAKQDEAPEGSVHNDDDDTETTVSCASDSVVGAGAGAGAGAAGAAGAAGVAGAAAEAAEAEEAAAAGAGVGAAAAAAAAAASGAIQKAMLAVKQEQHVLAKREEVVKRQRSKAARFCAESRARRRLRTMIFEQSADPATQQLQLTQLQHLQQSQIRNQARCLLHPLTPHPGPVLVLAHCRPSSAGALSPLTGCRSTPRSSCSTASGSLAQRWAPSSRQRSSRRRCPICSTTLQLACPSLSFPTQ